jgi:acyl carrier protein
MANREKLAEIMTMLLGQDITPDSDVSMANCAAWDSMKHIEIISTIEEELDISFPIGDIPKLTSFEMLAQAIDNMV